ncbi:hypothetical protein [Flavihumibacter profundi]|uniref:hypothetical protein n=1 Tax=Flavihumibacter profundi TaxID=2716883 RepID=UPI001CC79ADC|nr:hypothetical protein [Flavihumibacter profundi]MBZ5856078.1 hypothetical protein [Flavihumibacter profundi]
MNRLFAVILISALAACQPTTQIEKSWFEIGTHYTPSPSNKVLVVALVKDEYSRTVIEDNLVKKFKNPAVESYKLLTKEMIKEAKPEALEKYIAEGGFTHILLMRLAGVEEQAYYVPGASVSVGVGMYGGYGTYFGYAAPVYSAPGSYSTDKKYHIETAFYSVKPNKLLWTGTTKTENPKKLDKAVNMIADVVVDKMTKQGFLVR